MHNVWYDMLRQMLCSLTEYWSKVAEHSATEFDIDRPVLLLSRVATEYMCDLSNLETMVSSLAACLWLQRARAGVYETKRTRLELAITSRNQL